MKSCLCFAAAVLVALSPLARAYAAEEQKPQEKTRDSAALSAVLESNASQKEKADACRELARVGDAKAVQTLATLLSDDKLSHMARYAMEPIPGPAVDRAFRDALSKVQGRNLVGVIGSIGVRKDEKALKPLTPFLSSADHDVVQATARALGSIGTPAAAKALEAQLKNAAPEDRLAFYEGLLRAAQTMAREGSYRQAINICDRLRKVEDAPHQVRAAALRGSVLGRGEAGFPLLLEALRSDDFSQVAAAARIAQTMDNAGVVRVLASELPNLSTDKQILVIQTLAQRGDVKALPALLAAASAGAKSTRLEAIRALGRIGDASAIPLLSGLLDNADADTARLSRETLASIPGEKVDNAVMQMLTSNSSAQQTLGMELAVRRRMTDAVPTLLKTASTAEPPLRTTAVRRVGELGTAREIPAVLDLMGNANKGEDTEAIEQALGSLAAKSNNRDESIEQIASRLGGANAAQKSALIRVIAALGGPKALEQVRAGLKDSNTEVRGTSLRSLSSWSTPDAAPDLLELARTAEKPAERVVALRGYLSLAKLGDVPEAQRLEMCREAAAVAKTPEEKRLLLAALGDINSPQAVEQIVPHLSEDAVKEEGVLAVIGIADRLLKRDNASQYAAALVEPLEKAASATANQETANRAKALLEKARK